jgi:hypothetical protein
MKHLLSYPIWESVDSLKKLQEKEQAILFTDVKSSSKLWKLHEAGMFEALEEHGKRIKKILAKHDGMIVKTIGDSYMVSFEGSNSLLRAVAAGLDIQMDLREKPIKIKEKSMTIRLGICWGPLYKKQTDVQGKKLWDYFGNTVNTASRMESTVSEPGYVTFSFTENLPKSEEKKIEDLVTSKKMKLEIIDYQQRCWEGKRKRSGRLLSELQLHSCEPLRSLKGVAKTTAYKIKV